MFPIVQVVLAVLAGVAFQELVADPPEWTASRAYGLLFVALPWLYGTARRMRVRRMLNVEPVDWARAQKYIGSTGPRLRMVAVLGYVGVLQVGDWATFVAGSGAANILLADEAMLIAPYLCAALLAFIQEARLAADVRSDLRSPRRLVTQNLRMMGIPLVPLALVAAGADMIQLLGWGPYFESFQFLSWTGLGIFVILLFLVAPLMLRWLMPTRRLDDGPLRDSLMEFAATHRFRCREILVWETMGRYINAAIVGVMPGLRYVLLTDALLERLPPNEVRAVFAHEVAHGKRGHGLLYLLFALVFVLLLYAYGHRIPIDPWLGGAVGLGVLVVYWFVVFGFLSRRVEREADLFGASMVGHPEWMAAALQRISCLVGERTGPLGSWRHGTTRRRVETLLRFIAQPENLGRAQRATRRWLIVIALGLAGSVAAAAGRVPRDLAEGRVRLTLVREDLDAFETRVAEAIARYPRDPWFVFMRGIGQLERQQPAAAADSFLEAMQLSPGADLERAIRQELETLAGDP